MANGLKTLVRRDLPVLLKRAAGPGAMTALSLTLLMAAQAVIGGGLTRLQDDLNRSSSLAVIELSAIAPGATKGITEESMAEVRELDKVERVDPWYQVSMSLAPASWPDAAVHPDEIPATPWLPEAPPKIVAGEVDAAGPALGQIVLPDTVKGGSTRHFVGRTVTFEYTRALTQGLGEAAQIDLKVIAVVDNSVPGFEGPQAGYVSTDQLSALARMAGYGLDDGVASRAFVKVESADSVSEVQKTLASRGFGVDSTAERLGGMGGVFGVLRAASWVLAGMAVLVAVVAGSTVGSVWTQGRVRDIGVLRALGFTRSAVRGVILQELAIFGLIVGAAAAVLGVVASWIATTVVAAQDLSVLPLTGPQLPSWWLVVAVLFGVPACTVLGGLRSAVRASTVAPDTALRGL